MSNMGKIMKTLVVYLLLMAGVAMAVDYRDFQPRDSSRQGENVEWSTSYVYNKLDKSGAPRVLVIGDSICNGYNGELRKQLAPKMNLTFWASSLCVTDPTYFKTLDCVLESSVPDVILFNNTLHSPSTPVNEWRFAYMQAVRFIRAFYPKAKVILLNGTPLRDRKDEWVREKNAATVEIAKDLGLELIDFYSFCDKWDASAWRDQYHYTLEYIQKQAEFLAPIILKQVNAKDAKAIQVGTETGPNGKLD